MILEALKKATKIKPDKTNDDSLNGNTVISSFLISIFTILNIIIGFFFQITLARFFGTTGEADIYFAAITIPTLFNTVFISAINITFLPTLVKHQTNKQSNDSTIIVRDFLLITAILLTVIITLMVVFADDLLSVLFPGFSGEEIQATKQIFILLLPTIPLTIVVSISQSFYQAQRDFHIVAILPFTNNLVLLVITWVLVQNLGITAIAIATVLGNTIQLLLIKPYLQKIITVLDFKKFPFHTDSLQVFKIMSPYILSAVFYKSNNLIDRFVASQFDTGTISALGYAYRFMSSIQQILTQGISIVFFSIMAAYVASNNTQKLQSILKQGVRWTIILSFPSAVFMAICGETVIRTLFEHGQFNSVATLKTAQMLRAYLGAFVAGSIGSVLTYVFYAQQHTMTVALVGCAGFMVNLLAAIGLVPFIGEAAPAVAFSVASIFNFALLAIILQRQRILSCDTEIGLFTVKILISSIVASFSWYIGSVVINLLNVPLFINSISLLINLAFGLSLFFATGLLLRENEFVKIYRSIEVLIRR